MKVHLLNNNVPLCGRTPAAIAIMSSEHDSVTCRWCRRTMTPSAPITPGDQDEFLKREQERLR